MSERGWGEEVENLGDKRGLHIQLSSQIYFTWFSCTDSYTGNAIGGLCFRKGTYTIIDLIL